MNTTTKIIQRHVFLWIIALYVKLGTRFFSFFIEFNITIYLQVFRIICRWPSQTKLVVININSDKKFIFDWRFIYMRFKTDMFVIFDKPPYKNVLLNKVFYLIKK